MPATEGVRLHERVARGTGSGRDIGRATAERLAAAGVTVVTGGQRDRAAPEDTAAAIHANGGTHMN